MIYSNSLDGTLLFDDVPHLAGSADLHDLSAVGRWWNHDPRRPMGYLTLALNYHFHGLDVRGYHVTNLFIHIITGCLVYWLLLVTLSRPVIDPSPTNRARHVLSLGGALIFVSHPVQTQAISYIVQRLASQAALFYLLSLALYVQGRIDKRKELASTLCFVGSACAGVIAMLTKENAFTLPIAILLYEFTFLSTGKRRVNLKNVRVWVAVIALAIGLLVVPALMSFDLSRVFGVIPPEHGHKYTLTPVTYFLTQCRVLVTYVRLLVLPIHQLLDYDYPITVNPWDWRTLASIACLLAILALAVRRCRSNRLVAFGVFWFFLTLSVESSFIPIADVIFEHRLYLPMLGFCFVVIGLLIKQPIPQARGLLACLVVVLGIAAHHRNAVWRDGLALWTDVVRKAPNNARAHMNLGNEYLARNGFALAEAHLKKAIEINPNYGEGHSNLGSYYQEHGQPERGEWHLTRAIALVPRNAMAQYNLGTFYLGRGQMALAESHLRKAIDLSPQFTAAYTNLGMCMYQTGNDDSAAYYSERALRLDPREYRAFTNLGRVYKRKGDLNAAIGYYERAYEIAPMALDNLVNLGNAALAENQLSVAEEWYKKALAIDQRYALGLNGLGLVNYYRGEYAAAIKYLEDARVADPRLAATYQNLWLCYTATGQSKEATRIHEAALRLGR